MKTQKTFHGQPGMHLQGRAVRREEDKKPTGWSMPCRRLLLKERRRARAGRKGPQKEGRPGKAARSRALTAFQKDSQTTATESGIKKRNKGSGSPTWIVPLTPCGSVSKGAKATGQGLTSREKESSPGRSIRDMGPGTDGLLGRGIQKFREK